MTVCVYACVYVCVCVCVCVCFSPSFTHLAYADLYVCGHVHVRVQKQFIMELKQSDGADGDVPKVLRTDTMATNACVCT